MNILKTIAIFFVISSFPAMSIADTTLNYEFPYSDAAYLNVCSLKYKLNSGMCSKINLMNSKVNGRVGSISIDNDRLGKGDRAWVVFVDDDNNSKYRYLYYREIIGGKAYSFGPKYNNKVIKSVY
ncbi:MAG: hypothetical protein D3920_13840 [Candidatus Electrothrix sp. AW2]|nr:hypothetical protein [Candidatus Electrothrix gigas]MCI5197386.1 hypothetical protein [Candidatus Electrothrix gigas]